MAIPLIGGLTSGQFGLKIGQTYQPKKQRLMVGRDIAAYDWTQMAERGTRNIIIGDPLDSRFAADTAFAAARDAARQGFVVKGFNQTSGPGLLQNNYKNLSDNIDESSPNPTIRKGDYRAQFDGESLNITQKYTDEDGEEKWRVISQTKITGDTRLTWDENGTPSVLTGSAALTNGKLEAKGDDEIIIRKSGADVLAGNGTMVINLGGSGKFTGGSNVTYLGAYSNKSVIEGGTGINTYGGYFGGAQIISDQNSADTFSGVFEGTKIDGGQSGNTFSGYFRLLNDDSVKGKAVETIINGGNGKNTFNGLFLKGTAVNGGANDDRFNGRFIDSNVNGGAGDDTFGSGVLQDLYKKLANNTDGNVITTISSDFIGTHIDAGEGNDSFNAAAYSSSINMGDGNDNVQGIFTSSQINTGNGSNSVSAIYAHTSMFTTGDGMNRIDLATAISSSIITGGGNNEITLGRPAESNPTQGENTGTPGADQMLAGATFQTQSEHISDPSARSLATRYGELRGNSIDASKGQNNINVQNGENAHSVVTGSKSKDEFITETVTTEGSAGQDESGPVNRDGADSGMEDALARMAAKHMQSLLETTENNKHAESMTGSETHSRWNSKQLERYFAVMGDAPLESGDVAVTIDTGRGDPLVFRAAERKPGQTSAGTGNDSIHRASFRMGFNGEKQRVNFMV
ncbi:hypothetical protein LJC48_04800 [Desulfovibrio sp. OttesenSCG-928-C06]|nr:hypothetical protein [Desulfovibrio sp. OttesenSCG-928-C06]